MEDFHPTIHVWYALRGKGSPVRFLVIILTPLIQLYLLSTLHTHTHLKPQALDIPPL